MKKYLRAIETQLSTMKSDLLVAKRNFEKADRDFNSCQADIESLKIYEQKASDSQLEEDAHRYREQHEALTIKLVELEEQRQSEAEYFEKLQSTYQKLEAEIKHLRDTI